MNVFYFYFLFFGLFYFILFHFYKFLSKRVDRPTLPFCLLKLAGDFDLDKF